jgi:hypothetical protein
VVVAADLTVAVALGTVDGVGASLPLAVAIVGLAAGMVGFVL